MKNVKTREEKIRRSEEIVSDAYYKASVVDKLVTVRDSQPDDHDFLKLGKRTYIPEEWYSRGDIFYDFALKQLGENIAFSEKKFIIEEILKDERIRRNSCSEINPDVIKDEIQQIVREANIYPEILFFPIDFFTKIMHDWIIEDKDIRVETFENIVISGVRYRIFWSNKYIPFKEFIFANKGYGEWVGKPSFHDRFYVRISESDKPDKMDLLMYTTFKFFKKEPNRITILQQSEDE